MDALRASAHTPQVAADDLVKDVGLATFMVDVIEASKTQIIVVDFWAPWCGPCKQLGPALEKIVRAHKGAVRLVKIDIDKNPEIAGQMGVQSIPAVFAFFQGRPIDGFMGALPEAQIKSWVDRLVKTTGVKPTDKLGPDTALKQAADYLSANDVAMAQAIYTDLLELDPSNAAAYAGVLRCLIAQGDIAQAKAMLQKAPGEMVKDKAFDPVHAAIELADQAEQSGSVVELRAKVEQNPADHQARFDLALAYYAAKQKEEAVDQLLELVRRDRQWNDAAARKQLVKFFEVFGPTDPLTIDARKRLSSILFS
jgi:putative thioredoxin